MRLRASLGFGVSAALLAVGLGGVPQAAADTGTTLLVDRSAPTCSDQGTGSTAQPFCTVQSAVDAAQPGEIVLIANGTYSGFVVHHSGTPTAPITIKAQNYNPSSCDVCVYGSGTTPAATLDDVHDVRIQQLSLFSGANSDAVALADTQSVTLDQDSVFLSAQNTASASAAVVRIGAGSRSIALTRSTLQVDATGYGLRVEPGASGVQVASDTLGGSGQPALSVSGGSGVDVAGDSLWSWNASALTVNGSATGVSVENTTMYTDVRGGPTAPVVSVAADSVAGVHEDYNALNIIPKSTPEYDWGGTPLATTAAFTAATTQGAHETDQVPVVSLASPHSEGSGLIDSGDAQAPGELSTDLYGNPRVRDPLVPATGSASGYVDRGAIEFQDPIQDPLLTPASEGVAPFAVTVAPGPETAWKKALHITVDFGDGTSPVSEPAGQVAEHTYTKPGRYTETAVTTDTDGSTHSSRHGVDVLTATPVHPLFTASASVGSSFGTQGEVVPGYFTFSTDGTTDAWEIRSERIDYGDGTSDAFGRLYHDYRSIGVYHPSLTVTDLLGRTSTTTTTVIVGDELVPLSFADAYRSYDSSWAWAGDHAIPAHGTLRVSATTLQARNSGLDADAVVLNVSVPGARAAGYLTVFPEGTARPAAPTLSFAAGQSTSNQVTALIGKDGYVDLYNGSGSPLPLTIDTYATQNHNWEAFAFQPLAPTRIVGAQGSGILVAGHGSTRVSVAGAAGVPADARAVLLAVTASAGRGAGSVTVYGDGQAMPNTPALNWAGGRAVENLVLVPLTNGKVVLHNGGSGQVLLRADVLGYDSQTKGSTVHLPIAPTLFLDTRHGIGAPARQLAPHQSLRVRVAGVGALPTTGVAAATINVTVIGSTGSGYLEVHPDGSSPAADVPAVHWATGQTVSGAWVTRVGADGYVDLYNGGSRPVSVLADLSGIDYLYSAPAS